MADETIWCRIVERDGKKFLSFASGGKDESWYREKGFLPYGGVEKPDYVLGKRRTAYTVPVALDGKIFRARVYSDMTPDDYDKVMEEHLKQVRSERGYTTREPDDYFGSSVPRWAQDAADWVKFRDEVMKYALHVINEYEATGTAPTLMEFKAGLPKIEWTYEPWDES